jgi:hypothetical protein
MTATRRRFLGAAAAAAASLLRPFETKAQTTTPQPVPSPTPAPPPLSAAVARDRYGKFLSGDEAKLLDERLAGQERRSGRLRSFKLANSEEPATDFRVRR